MLIGACANNLLEVVQILIHIGVDINNSYEDSFGRRLTPLHWASKDLLVARLLIEKGADVNGVDHNGKTTLHSACICGIFSTVQLLIENGADVNLSDADGNTPFVQACSNGHLSIANLIIERAAADYASSTPFHKYI